jgi:hypothetical protein
MTEVVESVMNGTMAAARRGVVTRSNSASTRLSVTSGALDSASSVQP